VVYVGSNDGIFYALNASDGSLKWKHYFNNAVGSSPTVSGPIVYVNASGFVTDGASPTAAGELVFTGGFLGPFSALNASNGASEWHVSNGASYSNPAIVNSIVYSNSSPTVAQGKIYIADYKGYMFAIDSATGSLVWKCESLGAAEAGYQSDGTFVGTFSDPISAGGIIYAGNNDGIVYAIDAGTGQIKWSLGQGIAEHPAAPEVTVANGVVYCGTPWGAFYALNASGLSVRWTFQASGGTYAGACVTDVSGKVFHPGASGDQQ